MWSKTRLSLTLSGMRTENRLHFAVPSLRLLPQNQSRPVISPPVSLHRFSGTTAWLAYVTYCVRFLAGEGVEAVIIGSVMDWAITVLFILGVRHLTTDDERAAFPAARDYQSRRYGSRNRGDARRPPQVLQDVDPDENQSRWVLSPEKIQILFSAASSESSGASTRVHPCLRHHGSEATNICPVIYPGAHV